MKGLIARFLVRFHILFFPRCISDFLVLYNSLSNVLTPSGRSMGTRSRPFIALVGGTSAAGSRGVHFLRSTLGQESEPNDASQRSHQTLH